MSDVLKDSREPLAPVNKIIRFSSVDGPGNRTAIFLQGCNFDCRYCHNPETRALCNNCGLCVEKCPVSALSMTDGRILYNPALCILCDTCIHVCPNDASPRILWQTPSETFQEIRKQIPYIRGITVSGGECTLYPEYLQGLFTLCKEAGLTTLIDSNGTFDFASTPELLTVTDGVMLDIKAYDACEHQTVTGCDNTQVLKMAVFLASVGKLTEVRTVAVPELFDVRKTVLQTGILLKPYLPIRYKLISYRPFGVREQYSHYTAPSDLFLQECADALREIGWTDILIL